MAKKDWTERSADDFVFAIAADFMDKIQEKMEDEGISQDQLAKKLEVTAGRVSQLLHDPGNLTLQLVVKCARALDLKPSLFAYDDGDPKNELGAIAGEMFLRCWKNCGKPRNAWQLEKSILQRTTPFTVTLVTEVSDFVYPRKPFQQIVEFSQSISVGEMPRPEVDSSFPELMHDEEFIKCPT